MKMINTPRLLLREFKIKDSKELAKSLNNLNVTRWLLTYSYPYRFKNAKEWIYKTLKKAKKKPREDYDLAIILKDKGELVGNIGLMEINRKQKRAEVGFWVGEEYWGKHYASEALKAILEFGFKRLKLKKIKAQVYVGNKSSERVLTKYGFKKEGKVRKKYISKADGKTHDTNIYWLLKKDLKVD